MFKKNALICLFIFCLLLAECSFAAPIRETGKILKETAEDWGQIDLDGGYRLINNVWNKGAAAGPYKQRIFQEKLKGKPAFGWQWQWPGRASVVAYPEIVYGDKPWDKPLELVPELPLLAGSKKITADFDIKLNASGIYNMAFELWTVSALPATNTNITHEIMIWITNHGQIPAGWKQDTLNVGKASFDVYIKKGHGDASGQAANNWSYIAFVSQKPLLKGPLNMSAFIDYLLDKNILTKDLYITSLELGNEIVDGEGIVEISNYAVKIQ